MNQTPIQNQLIQTICTLAPHGLQVQYKSGDIFTIDATITSHINEKQKLSLPISIDLVKNGSAKLLLHSTSKLTEPILEDGKVPIVELFKIAFPNAETWYLTEKGTILRKHLLGHLEFSYDIKNKSFISRHYNKEWNVIGYFNVPNQLELFNFMFENHFNLFNLSEEYYVEKSTLKN